MIDTTALKSQVDLLALAGRHTALQRVAASGGGEWAGPCPFCGGQDRFHVQPQAEGGGRWLCRGCTGGKWQDALEFGVRLWPGLSFPQVCALLGDEAGSVAYSLSNSHSHHSLSTSPTGGAGERAPAAGEYAAVRSGAAAGRRRGLRPARRSLAVAGPPGGARLRAGAVEQGRPPRSRLPAQPRAER